MNAAEKNQKIPLHFNIYFNLPDDAILLIFSQLGISWKKTKYENVEETEASDDTEETIKISRPKIENSIEKAAELNVLTLVCKRWKSLVDTYHIYQKLRFFQAARSEHHHLLESKKKFQQIAVKTLESYLDQLKCQPTFAGNFEML
jgi:hypothetical protein